MYHVVSPRGTPPLPHISSLPEKLPCTGSAGACVAGFLPSHGVERQLRDARRARDFARRQVPVLIAEARNVRNARTRGTVAGEHKAEDLLQVVLVADGDQLVLLSGLVFVLRLQHHPRAGREILYELLDVLLGEIAPRQLTNIKN